MATIIIVIKTTATSSLSIFFYSMFQIELSFMSIGVFCQDLSSLSWCWSINQLSFGLWFRSINVETPAQSYCKRKQMSRCTYPAQNFNWVLCLQNVRLPWYCLGEFVGLSGERSSFTF